MFSKEKQRVKSTSDINYCDEFISNEEHCSSNEVTHEPSFAEEVFMQLSIYSEGFNPNFFTNKDLANLSLSSIPLHSTVVSELQQRAARKLLTHVVKGEPDEAQVMIEKNPQLLLMRTQAIDYSGRTITGTAFQAALGAGDKPMWEMMLPHFEKEEALSQFDEQFPKGIKETSASELYAYYNAIALAIIQNEEENKDHSIVERFRNEITSQKKITQGIHFNLEHLIAAFQVYLDIFNALGTIDKCNFFWRKVIGYVQRQITAYDAQIFCSGVKCVLENKNQFERSLNLGNVGRWFPLSIESGLGFDFAYYSSFGGQTKLVTSILTVPRHIPGAKNYVEEKQRALAELRESLSKECITRSLNYAVL